MAWPLLKKPSVALLLKVCMLVVGLLAGLPVQAAPDRVSQAVTEVVTLSSRHTRLVRERAQLQQAYAQLTAEIARLKGQPASWSRDRKLEAVLAGANDQARRLNAKDAEVRAAAAQVATRKTAAIQLIDGELAARPTAERAAQLVRQRTDLAGKPGKRIRIADETIDPLDDPEDLEDKAKALAQSELDLVAEEKRLGRRVVHHKRQAKLAHAKNRGEDDPFIDDSAPRRPGQLNTNAGGRDPDSEAEQPAPTADPGDGVNAPPTGGSYTDGDFSADPAIVLADVIDPRTVEDLRRAQQSGDPESQARAAEKAQKEVQARIERLRKRRQLMEQRARELRE
jgi:hypothetical protein